MGKANNEKVMVYIDNSNIFISTIIHSGKKRNFLNNVLDNNCRIDIGKLVNEASGGRELIHAKLYGSESSPLGTVWEAIEKKKIEVHTMEKSGYSNKEKRVDTELCVQATRDLIEFKDKAGDNKNIIFFTGDVDMKPVVRVALDYKWKVEIWSYNRALNKEYQREMKELRGNLLTIRFIDEIFDKITFQEFDWDNTIPVPRKRSIICKFPKKHTLDKQKLEQVVCKAMEIFRLPFLGKIIDMKDNTSTNDMLLVPSCNEKNNGKQLYDVDKDIWGKAKQFKKSLSCKLVTYVDYKNHLCQNEYDVTPPGDDELNNNDNGTSLNDPELQGKIDDFEEVRRKQSKKHQFFSKSCDYGFRCYQGLKCNYAHSDEEKDFFRTSPNMNRALYKSKQCIFGNRCKYIRRPAMCPFVHEKTEVRCLNCKSIGAHWTDECPIPRDPKA